MRGSWLANSPGSNTLEIKIKTKTSHPCESLPGLGDAKRDFRRQSSPCPNPKTRSSSNLRNTGSKQVLDLPSAPSLPPFDRFSLLQLQPPPCTIAWLAPDLAWVQSFIPTPLFLPCDD